MTRDDPKKRPLHPSGGPMFGKKQCIACEYRRDAGSMEADIDGAGPWCSNSKSPSFRQRVLDNHTCLAFARSGGKAPLSIRLGKRFMKAVNAKLQKRKS